MSIVVRLGVILAGVSAVTVTADEAVDAERPQARQMRQLVERRADPAGRAGTALPAYLGIVTGPVSEELREHVDLPERGGLVITRVEPGSPAAKAGLKANDILLKLDGLEVTSPIDLADLIEAAGSGAQASLTLVRRGKPLEIEAVLGARRAAAGVDGRPAGAAAGGPAGAPALGIPMEARDLLAQAEALADAGVVVAAPGTSIQVQTSTIGGVRESRAVSRDGEGTVEIVDRGGRKTVTILGPDGSEIHEGPLGGPEDFETVPEEWREKVRRLDARASAPEGRRPVPPGGV